MAERKTREGSVKMSAGDEVREILGQTIRELREAGLADGTAPRLFFPSGIGLLEIVVEVAGAKVALRVASEKGATAGEAAAAGLGLESFAMAAAASDDLVLGQKVPNQREADTVGPTTTIIRRDSPEFATLVRNDNPDIVFKDEEGTAADRMMTRKLKAGLDALAALVRQEWPGVKLRVTEAWDENLEHAQRSVHYEGRGADLTTAPLDPAKLGRLGRLAVEAGLEWVFFEDSRHVHVSVSR